MDFRVKHTLLILKLQVMQNFILRIICKLWQY